MRCVEKNGATVTLQLLDLTEKCPVLFAAGRLQNCVMFVLRLRLFPGFLPLEQADWMFSKLLAELPWSQKTNYGMMGE